ncbi:MAG: hypothetical protein H6698_07860 [Myxococcales bacterium]|nr:hypothetical protein [Myxococcales bacterium]MCB9521089.1 hypothetical protein [Myxococcales bacterium]MCB9534202.1 hypothetical protein [Myxococcales bacterium]
MDALTLDPAEPTRIVDRRYRRSQLTTEALAFQCAHVQEGLELDALIVSDDTGDRWVGAGDKALCRLLSRSAPAISGGDDRGAMRMRALQVLRSDLSGTQLTACRIQVPRQDRFIYVTGVGTNRMRPSGVVSAATGTKRILGYERPVANATSDGDAQRTLQRVVDGAYARLVSAHGVRGDAPSAMFGFVDDRAYRDTLAHILAPAVDMLAQSGLIVDDLWRNYRLRTRETRVDVGVYERTFASPIRDGRTATCVGELDVKFTHRHDVFDIPYCPRVALRWR